MNNVANLKIFCELKIYPKEDFQSTEHFRCPLRIWIFKINFFTKYKFVSSFCEDANLLIYVKFEHNKSWNYPPTRFCDQTTHWFSHWFHISYCRIQDSHALIVFTIWLTSKWCFSTDPYFWCNKKSNTCMIEIFFKAQNSTG